MTDLERRIRAANPIAIGRATPLSSRAEAELQALLATAPLATAAPRPAPALKRARLRGAWVTGLAAVLVFVTVFVVGNVTNRPQSSAASSPPLLTSVAIDATVPEILGVLSAAARDIGPSAASSERTVRSEAWSADISVDDESNVTMFVQPQEISRVWNDELSGRVTAVAGEVRWGADSASAAEPGTVLVDEEYGRGQYPAIFATRPPSTAAELRSYLAAPLGLDDQSTAGQWFKAVQDLRADWPLDGDQNAALLDLLATLPDVSVAGTVTDRLGREGVAVETESRVDGVFRDILVFDSATGFLISAEDVYLGGLNDISLPAMTVLNYSAWKDVD